MDFFLESWNFHYILQILNKHVKLFDDNDPFLNSEQALYDIIFLKDAFS